MIYHEIIDKIENNPIIAAIRNDKELDKLEKSDVEMVFLLHTDIFSVSDMVKKIKDQGKVVFLHMDFIDGLGKDNRAIDYIHHYANPDGIISTKSTVIKYAKEKGLFTIQRFFLIDSLSYETTIKTVKNIRPHMIEVMPGVIPKVIKRISKEINIPIIAGGMITDKEDIIEVLSSGACGVSVGKSELWEL